MDSEQTTRDPSPEQVSKLVGCRVCSVDPVDVEFGGHRSRIFECRSEMGDLIIRLCKGQQGYYAGYFRGRVDESKWFDHYWAMGAARDLSLPAPEVIAPRPKPPRRRVAARSKPETVASRSAAVPAAPAHAARLAQAHAANATGQYQEAVSLYEEVLELEPGSVEAQVGRENALRQVAGAKTLVASVTQSRARPAGKKSGPAGFDTDDVKVAHEPSGARLEFKMIPASMTPGRPFKVHVSLRNLGEEPIDLKDVRVTVVVNGERSAKKVGLKSRKVGRGEVKLLAEIPGVWPEDVTSWKVSTTVVAGDGAVYSSDASWK